LPEGINVTFLSDTPWVDGLTIGQVLARTVERFPHRDALVFPRLNYRRTWRQFGDDVAAAARGLLALGIKKGEHVAIWATNVPEWVVLQFATAEIGAVLVTINPAYRPFELKYVLQQSDAVALFLVDRFKTSNYFEMLADVCPQITQPQSERLHCDDFPKLRNVVAIKGEHLPGMATWSQMLALGEKVRPEQLARAESLCQRTDAINIQYTSGTTGFPKAAMLSHRNLLLNAYYVGGCQQFTEQDRICIPVPFYHCFGCVLGTLAAVVYGAAMVIPNEYFKPAETLCAIEQERCTALYGVPTMFIAQLEDPLFPEKNLRSLRTGIMSGAPCPIEIMRQVTQRMHIRELTIAYGQTEASPVITQSRTDDPLELRVETVGRPLPGWEVKIADPATGHALPDNSQGELCARGHGVMLGYYKNPEATANAIDADGWLHTGDLAMRLSNGCFKITGRIKEMVIRGGENIYPREIEEFLFTHPAVQQSAVVGVPDLKYGEELCAWVMLKAGQKVTEDELREFCRSRLAHYKVPRYFRFVEAFPQTVTGKIQKFKIRETMIAELGLQVLKTA
jgi:fatty-acyl-CoA synthase